MNFRRLLVLTAILVFSLLRVHAVNYFDGNVYKALVQAQSENKMLIAEFYAQWNYKSTWMHDKIFADPDISKVLEKDFVTVLIDTETPDGAALAVNYQLTNYPCIVIFASSGEPLDKIDQTLDKEDFLIRIEQLMMTVGGNSAWRFRSVMAAAEENDVPKADRLALDYIAGQPSARIITHNHWKMFQNNNITFYQSAAFEFMLAHLTDFYKVFGELDVNKRIESIFIDAIMPLVVETQEYDSVYVAGILDDIRSLDINNKDMLLQLLLLLELRHNHELSPYVDNIAALTGKIPEDWVFNLMLALNAVAENGSKDERQKSLRLINRLRPNFSSSSQAMLLDDLTERLNNREKL